MSNSSGLATHRDDDGRFYAEGNLVRRMPIARVTYDEIAGRCTGITMGWVVAEAANEQAALAIADALNIKFADEIAKNRAAIEAAIKAETGQATGASS
jgi:hypothetical protein